MFGHTIYVHTHKCVWVTNVGNNRPDSWGGKWLGLRPLTPGLFSPKSNKFESECESRRAHSSSLWCRHDSSMTPSWQLGRRRERPVSRGKWNVGWKKLYPWLFTPSRDRNQDSLRRRWSSLAQSFFLHSVPRFIFKLVAFWSKCSFYLEPKHTLWEVETTPLQARSGNTIRLHEGPRLADYVPERQDQKAGESE